MNFNLTAVLLLFGLVQSIIMITLIFRSRNWRTAPNILLIALLFVAGLSLLPTFFGHTGLIARYGHLRFMPFNLVIFIFPIVYLYYLALFRDTFRLAKDVGVHLLIPTLFTVYHFFVWIGTLTVSLEEKSVWAMGVGFFEVQLAHTITLSIFVFGYTAVALFGVRAKQQRALSKVEQKFRRWIVCLLIFFVVGVLFELTATLLGQIYGYWKSSPLDDWLGFSLTMAVKIYNAVLLYTISLVAYLTYTNTRRNRTDLDKVTIEKQLQLIVHTMETQKPYLSNDFSLPNFSKLLQLTPAVVSHVLNAHLKTSFTDFTNKFRVAEVKRRIQGGAYTNYTIESIAADSGFKSKTTFYRAFYKFTSQTPKEYMK